MNTKIFDGRAFAAKKDKELKLSVAELKKKGITPKLVTILVGDNPAGKTYVDMKKKAGERIGVDVNIVKLSDSVHFDELIHRSEELDDDRGVNGIMVQLPLPKKFSYKDRDKIINSIDKKKDVDGMRDDSPYLAPVVKAVLYALKEVSLLPLKVQPCKAVVVGHTGFEGKKIYKTLKEMSYDVEGADKRTKNLKEKTLSADILISATGVRGLIKESMVKEGCVLIDVGAPDGDIDKKAYKKAFFVSPVPGGIGPVTIVSLLENLVEACE